MQRNRRRRGLALACLCAAALASGMVVAAAPADAASTTVVISGVFGGGGNSGSPYSRDYVELFNKGTSSVTVTGWTVQYASAAGSTWSRTSLSGTLSPGHYYLVAERAGSSGGTALPVPDASGSIAMSATSGKVALVTNATALTCKNNCDTASGVRDFVGYGTSASSAEGSPTPNLSNTTAAQRDNGGATDTDDNAADFTVEAPTPRNSSTGTGGGGGTRIHDIQGHSHLSPLAGDAVTNVPGVATAKTSNGFWMQDPTPDADPATSEAVYVYTGSAPTVAVGDSVAVSATVNEYRPGGASSGNLTTTELTGPTVTVAGHNAPLPAATVVGSGGRVPPNSVIEDDATGNVETSGTFDPATDGIDFWESLEGMRLEIDNAAVVGPTNSYGETPVVPQGSGTRTNRGGIVTQAGDFNPERVIVTDGLVSVPSANVGDTYASVVGVLDYGFGNFALEATATPSKVSGNLRPETTAAATSGQLAVATFNVENLAPGDAQSKFDALATTLVNNLKAPDVVALEEIQDNSGATDNGVVAADQTLTKLVTAISAAGGPSYTWREIDPVNDADGGQPGGNIRSVLLYRTDRGLAFVDRPGSTATTADLVVNTGGVPSLKYSPGRIAPTDSAWNSSRKPLAGEFTWHGKIVFVIANHFNSKGGDDPVFGVNQPPSFPSETQRHSQATLVRGFVDQLRAVDPNAAVVVLGDLNDYDFSQTASILTSGGGLTDLPATLPIAERYTYVYQGNSQVLDHILLSPALAATAYAYDVVHVNSEFATQVSDHEPQVVRIPLP